MQLVRIALSQCCCSMTQCCCASSSKVCPRFDTRLDPMLLRQIRLPSAASASERQLTHDCILEFLWASRRTVPVTSDAFAPTVSGSECRRSGDAKSSAADARRAESASPFSSRPSTPAPDPSSKREEQRFSRRQRITRGADLQSIAREGKRLRTACLDVRVVVTPRHESRIGFVVPKHGQSAVRRNRLKRMLRELARRTILSSRRAPSPEAGSSMDIVMRTLPAAYTASFGALRAEFESLSARLLRLIDASSSKTNAEDVSGSSSGH